MPDKCELYVAGVLDTTNKQFPKDCDGPVPDPEVGTDGQNAAYWVLSESERAKGFVRPVRDTYFHQKCLTSTRMGRALAETYARDPHFYGSTFCVHCGGHYLVGPNGDFVWEGTDEKVGT
jgi:hypothetical protein